jgi:hypothetical protein
MPEILTESFCERYGTRYTFESASPKGPRLKGLRTVSRGLKNFVMSDDTSMDEAMAAARNETDREATSQQLDAFHKTFNFCMSCRQYTCSNCWNEVEGRCLSCAPHLGQDVLGSPFPNVETSSALPFGLTSPVLEDHNGHDQPDTMPAAPMAWPTSDLMREEEQAAVSFESVIAEHEAEAEVEPEIEEIDPLARLAALDWTPAEDATVEPAAPVAETAVEPEAAAFEPEPEPARWETLSVEPEPTSLAPEPEPEPVEAEPVEAEPVSWQTLPAETEASPWQPDVEPVAADASPETVEPEAAPEEFDDRAAAASAQTSDLFRRFSAGQDIDDAIAAYELAQAAADALADAPETTPAPAQPPVQPQAQPTQTAAPEPEPERVAAVAQPEPALPAEPEPAVPAGPPVPAPQAVPEVEPEPIAAVAWPEPESRPEPEIPTGPEPVAPVVPPERLPAPDLDRIAAWTQPAAPPEPQPEPEPVAEPMAPPPGYEPEPIAAGREDLVPQPTWQIVAPENPPEPEWPAQPQWPAQPEWPSPREATDGLAFLGRPAQPTGGIEALWAESAREVTAGVATAGPGAAPVAGRPAGGVQPCVSCGLSLSANARFCRRCGSRQG